MQPGICTGDSRASQEHIPAALRRCSGERLCSGDSAHKERPDNEAVNGELHLKKATMAVHAGN